ncbi:hypothetical protein OVS_00945 [Mycoplasma ovis str. Michigan]|uniref:Uncharacterized protein n=1 Tax=Mycoplasma ovis str. Michigan TaxID=1415773 RepID=A0ABN4BQN7_9MOLU|nr:hypothetical protein [Mycoplasma ovis]AHC40165.1 hypothetical protein OVS_00945 [Mycoplasma ovis str. Michigan]
MANNLSIYILFKKENLLVTLFNFPNKKVFTEFEIPFLEIVPKLVKTIDLKLAEHQLDFNSIGSIFIAQRESRWNSNRLVVAFVQTLAFAFPINIYKKDLGDSEELDFCGDWNDFLNSFKEISWKELTPLYNKCPITNT